MKTNSWIKLITTCCILMIIFPFTGCKRSETAGSGSSASRKNEIERFESVINKSFKYDYMQAKARFSMSGHSLKGNIRMERNKRFSASINAPLLGFEIIRIEANTDSMYFVNKMDKQYISLSWDALREKIGGDISIEALQCLFLGQIYVPGEGTARKSDFKRFAWNLTDDNNLWAEYSQNPLYTLTYNIGENGYLKHTALSPTGKNASVQWSYASYLTTTDNKTLPSEETVSVKIGEKQLKGTVTLEQPTFSQTGWNAFIPGDNYRKIEPKQLLELLNKLKK